MAIIQPYCPMLQRMLDRELRELAASLSPNLSRKPPDREDLMDSHPVLEVFPTIGAVDWKNRPVDKLQWLNAVRRGEKLSWLKLSEPELEPNSLSDPQLWQLVSYY